MIGDFGMHLFNSVLAAGEPTPTPTTVAPMLDPSRVTAGGWGFLSFMFLIVVAIFLYFSLRKQLKRVNFDENETEEAGSRRVDLIPTRRTDEAGSAGTSGGSSPAAKPAGPSDQS